MKGHVVGGIGETQDMAPDEGGGGAEGAVVVSGHDDGELLDNVKIWELYTKVDKAPQRMIGCGSL